MARTQYRCKNFGGCNKALEREIIEIEDGEEAVCPECGLPLEPVIKPKGSKPNNVHGSERPGWLIPVGALALIAAVALGLTLLHHSTPTPPLPPARTIAPLPPQTSPQLCDDTHLGDSLRKRIAAEDDLKEDHIVVDVAKHIVVLSGIVSSESDRARAADLVRYTNCPVASVLNQLSAAPSDLAIDREVRKRLSANPELRHQPIRVAVSHGVVVLSGSVAEPSMRSNASSNIAEVSGVTNVLNNLDVKEVKMQPPPSSQPLTMGRSSLSGTWTGTYTTCAQAIAPVTVQMREAGEDDVVASFRINVPGDPPGTFTVHGTLNTMNGFLTLPFTGWEHQPSGISMGNVGGLVVFAQGGAYSFSGTIRPPGCGQITLRRY